MPSKNILAAARRLASDKDVYILLRLRADLYSGSSGKMASDLLARLDERPYDHKRFSRIRADLVRLSDIAEYENCGINMYPIAQACETARSQTA